MTGFNMLAILTAGLSLCTLAHAAEFVVTVGDEGSLRFEPEFVNAAVNDVIFFQFRSKNHTVTQSSLGAPCTALGSGFDSGFVPVAATDSDFPVARLVVEDDTTPVWTYCRQGNHCNQGMVFALNPGPGQFEEFKANAMGETPESPDSPPATATPATTIGLPGASTTEASTSATPSPSVSTDHKVVVGGEAGNVYTPSSISAEIGDTITFEFRRKNHTVTASSFDQPCRALSSASALGEDGFDSGFMPVSAAAVVFPTYTIQVNDTRPIWAYCRQGNHCGTGMVFSVNAPETGNTFEAFQEKAIEINGTGSTQTPSDNDDDNASNKFGASAVLVTLAAFFALL